MNLKESRKVPEKGNHLGWLLGPRIEPEHVLDARGARRWFLLIPALIQLLVALMLIYASFENSTTRRIDYSLALILIMGGIGLLSRRRRLFWVGLLCATFGFLLPIIIQAVATPVDKDYFDLPGIGLYDAEGVGTLMFFRLMEFPFWLFYGGTIAVLWVRRHRMTTISQQ
jgi:hypothetical protein